MPLTIIAGRAGSGKSAKIYKMINELISAGKSCVLIVPEQFTLQAESELIASGNHSGLFLANVMSVSRLASDIFSTVGAPKGKFLDTRGKAAALSYASLQIKDELKIFSRSVSYAGFASEFSELIGDFKKYGITPDTLNISKVGKTTLTADKISDVRKIYGAYESFMQSKNYIDSDDITSILADYMPKADKYKDTHFFFDGFDVMTAQEVAIIKAMLNLSGKITVGINYANNSEDNIFFSGKKTLDDLVCATNEAGVSYKILYAENPHVKKHPSITHIEQNIYTSTPIVYDRDSAVSIYEASSTLEEAEHTACKILKLVNTEKSLRLDNISVLCCSNLNEYGPLLERIFKRYDIPCFIHRRKPISEHPAVSYILSAITSAAYGCPQSEILSAVKSGYAGLTSEDSLIFEDYVLDNSIDGYLFEKPLKRGASKYDLKKMETIRQDIILPISLLSKKVRPASSHIKSIYKMIEQANIKQTLEHERETLMEAKSYEYAAMTSQVYNNIIGILEQLHSLFEDRPMNLEEVLLALEESFISTQIGILPVSSDEVLIGELGRSKLAETKHLFIVGANEGSLPPPISSSAILSDWDIETLSENGVEFMKNIRAKRGLSDYAVYQALSLPSEGLYISYSANSANGSMPASPIINTLQEILNLEIQPAAIDYTVSKAAALSVAAKAFGAIGDGRSTPDGWQPAVSALLNKSDNTQELDKMRGFLTSPEKAFDIAPKKDRVIVSSVSQIEQYSSCPFSYMVNYSLRPTDDPGKEITAAGEGAFLHEAMERFSEAISQYDLTGLSDFEIEEIMRSEAQIISQNFDNQRLSRDENGKYQANQLIKTAKHGAIIYTKHLKNSKFVPQGQEIEFGEGKALGPIKVDLSSGTQVSIGGKVDRLDVFEDAGAKLARIVDYKSSVKKVEYQKIESGRQLQLFIYMDAFLSKNPSFSASGVFYFPLRMNYIDDDSGEKRDDKMRGLFVDTPLNTEALDCDIEELGNSSLVNAKRKKDGGFDKNSDNISAEKFNKIMCYAKDKAKDTLELMDTGAIPVKPVSSNNALQCSYCEFSSICKKDINMHEERAELTKDAAKKIILGEDDA